MPSKIKLFTIGHSTHPLVGFLALLARQGIEALVDIRRFPGSRKFPSSTGTISPAALEGAGIGLPLAGGPGRPSAQAAGRIPEPGPG